MVSNGYVPEVNTTTANFHDSKGSVRLIAGTLDSFKDVVHSPIRLQPVGSNRMLPAGCIICGLPEVCTLWSVVRRRNRGDELVALAVDIDDLDVRIAFE